MRRWLVGLLVLAAAVTARADRTQERLALPDGRELVYELITPEPFDPGRTYPVAVVFPGGPQTLREVLAAANTLDPDCRARGWIVASPAAVQGRLMFRGGEANVLALFAELRRRFRVEHDRFHLLGPSNGGLTAMRLAIDRPEDVRSVTVMPGYLPDPSDAAKLPRLRGIPLRIFIGSDDRVGRIDAARALEAAARSAGLDVKLDVRGAQPHVIGDLSPKELLDMLDGFRGGAAPGDGAVAPEAAEVAAVLDQLHVLASKADEEGYFALFAPEAVFIGTDATERWTLAEFRAYAHPRFSKGKGWTYTPRDRHIEFTPDKQVAWFDELLDNEKYGECRGSGVLRKVEGRWRIAQYHLTVPVPNDLMERVAGLIRREAKERRQP